MPTSKIAAKKLTPPRLRSLTRPDFRLVTDLQRQGYQKIIGVDEVGRGALAGPIVVAAVEVSRTIDGVTDSKQIPKQNRTIIAHALHRLCPVVRFGQATNREIDEFGLTAALALAYRRALEGLEADLILTDHYDLPTSRRFIRATKGDSLFFPVAAASIVAKVYRDQLMAVYAHFFPNYGWADNAGYGTSYHLEALDKSGPSNLHRKSFSIGTKKGRGWRGATPLT